MILYDNFRDLTKNGKTQKFEREYQTERFSFVFQACVPLVFTAPVKLEEVANATRNGRGPTVTKMSMNARQTQRMIALLLLHAKTGCLVSFAVSTK